MTILAIIAVVLGVAALAWGAWTLHNQLTDNAAPADPQSNEANTQESAVGRDGGVASSPPSQVLQPPTEHKKESEPAAADDSEGVHQRRLYPQAQKFTSNFWIALFTAGLFVVAFIQWLTVSWQANIMADTLAQMQSDSDIAERNSNSARDSAEAAQAAIRAWPFIDLKFHWNLRDVPTGAFEYRYTATAQNYGASPYRILSCQTRIHIEGTTLDNTSEWDSSKFRGQLVIPNGANEEIGNGFARDQYEIIDGSRRNEKMFGPVIIEITMHYTDFIGGTFILRQIWDAGFGPAKLIEMHNERTAD